MNANAPSGTPDDLDAPSSELDAESIPEQVGPYLIESALGQGGFGAAYVAVRTFPAGFTKRFALKRMLPIRANPPSDDADDSPAGSSKPAASRHSREARARKNRYLFEDEARALTLLDPHPGIVQLVDFFEDEKQMPILVMEYVDGVDLRHLLAYLQKGRLQLPAHVATYIAAELCSALAYGHSLPQHIVHRDLKPSNVFIGFDGHVKLGDFGIAKFRGAPVQTASDELKGTLSYMSPEHFDPSKIDAQSDLFSLGALLYKMLSGRTPFPSGSVPEAYAAITQGRITPIQRYVPNIDPTLVGLLAEMLEPEKARRVKTATDVRRRLLTLTSRPDVRDALAALVQHYRATQLSALGLGEAIIEQPDVQPAVEPIHEPSDERSVSESGIPIGTHTLMAVSLANTKSERPDARPASRSAARRTRVWYRSPAILALAGAAAITAAATVTVLSLQPKHAEVSIGPSAAAPKSPPAEPAPTQVPAATAAPAATPTSTTPEKPPAAAPAASPKSEKTKAATLHVSAYKFGWIFIDGKPFGPSPVQDATVKAGRHSITVMDAPSGGRLLKREELTLRAGEARALRYQVTH